MEKLWRLLPLVGLLQLHTLTALAEADGDAKTEGLRYERSVQESARLHKQQGGLRNLAENSDNEDNVKPRTEEEGEIERFLLGGLRGLEQSGNGNGNQHGHTKKNDDLFVEVEDHEPMPYLIGEEHSIASLDDGDGHRLKNCDNGNNSLKCLNPDVIDEESNTATYTVTHQDSPCVAVHFGNWAFKPDCSATISNADGSENYEIDCNANGRQKKSEGFWSPSVYGETIKVTTKCSSNRKVMQHAPIEIDTYAACFSDEDIPSRRQLKICGDDDRDNAVCYKGTGTEGDVYNASKAVARINFFSEVGCTGFLASPANRNFVMAPRSCFKDSSMSFEDMAQNADVEFMAERSNCGADNCANCGVQNAEYVKCPSGSASLVMKSYEWDYAVIEINDTTCVDKNGTAITEKLTDLFGYIRVYNGSDVSIGEQISIPQHPRNKAKEIAIYSDQDDSGFCEIRSTTEKGKCVSDNADDTLLGFACDTEYPRGAPIISTSPGDHYLMAVGINMCGKTNCPGAGDRKLNKGASFNDICEHMCDDSPGVPANRKNLCEKICYGT